MGKLSPKQASMVVRIVGDDELYAASVELIGGKKRLLTDSTGTVESSTAGFDPFPDSWFSVDNAGAIGDTFRIQIAATTGDPSIPDSDAPAVDVTFTVTASEAGDEIACRDAIIVALNTDVNFAASLKAATSMWNVVHVSSIFGGIFWERLASGDFAVTTTGVAAITLGSDVIQSKSKKIVAQKCNRVPHELGMLGVCGTVNTQIGAIGNRYFEFLRDPSSSRDMLVNGSSSPVVFAVPSLSDYDIYVQQLRLVALSSSIKYKQFLGIATLSNGLLIEVKSDNVVSTFEVIKNTEDFSSYFSYPSVDNFNTAVEVGVSKLFSNFIPENPFVLRKSGSFGVGNDDYVRITVSDDLDKPQLQQFEAICMGYTAEG